MSLKTFCDVCHQEVNWTGEFNVDHIGVVSVIPEDASKHICLHCTIDAINKSDDRPKSTGGAWVRNTLTGFPEWQKSGP